MLLNDVQLLLIIVFLHFFSQALVIPLLSPHMISIGASHTIIGLHIAGTFGFQMLSKDFVALFDHSKKLLLTFCLFTSFLCYMLIASSDWYFIVLVSRFIYSLVNYVETCAKNFVQQTQPEEEHIKILNVMNTVKTGGIVSGAILGGHMFNCSRDFELNAMAAALFTLIAVLLVQHMEQAGEGESRESNIKNLPEVCYKRVKDLVEMDHTPHWDVMLMKGAYTATFVIFFAKFATLIGYNYDADAVITGYTVAYQKMLLFATEWFVPTMRTSLERFSTGELFEHSLLICSFCLMGIYFAPTYDCYLLMYMPMVVAYSTVNSCMEDDVLGLAGKADINEAFDTLTTMINIVIPVVFCFLYEILGMHAFKILGILPAAICVYIVTRWYFNPRAVKED